jgi:hypothetical protein
MGWRPSGIIFLSIEHGWAIVGDTLTNENNCVTHILWHCPNSQNLPLSSRHSWIPVNDLACGRESTSSYGVE